MADLRVRATRPFGVTDFERRQKAVLLDTEVWVLSPEDAIPSKLESAKESRSQEQMQDALGVLQVRRGSLDEEYLRKWAGVLAVRDLLSGLLEEARRDME
jgi:hypothetical protein